jgi:putative addiction module component (TIGR02574 family)
VIAFCITIVLMNPNIDISQLSPAECILLAEQLWERARSQAGAVPVTEAQLAELNRRLDAHERGEMPPGTPWEEVDAWLGTL